MVWAIFIKFIIVHASAILTLLREVMQVSFEPNWHKLY